uniref:CSON008677 protein n=1 Tax=Culicoides sonorensis TaxID=179676 RepID=A0A336MW52_CULSO
MWILKFFIFCQFSKFISSNSFGEVVVSHLEEKATEVAKSAINKVAETALTKVEIKLTEYFNTGIDQATKLAVTQMGQLIFPGANNLINMAVFGGDENTTMLLEEIQKEVHEINNRLTDMSKTLASLEKDLLQKLDKISNTVDVQHLLNKFTDIRIKIESKLKSLDEYTNLNIKFTDTTIDQMDQEISGVGSDTLRQLLRQLYLILFEDDGKLFKYLVEELNEKIHFESPESDTPHDKLYRMLLAFKAIEVRSMLLFNYECEIIKMRKNITHTEEKKAIALNSDKRINLLHREFKNVLKNANSTWFKLDPKKHIHNETYVMITRFHQPYYINEATFGTCKGGCQDHQDEIENFEGNELGYDDNKVETCNGTLYGCQTARDYHNINYINTTKDSLYYSYSGAEGKKDHWRFGGNGVAIGDQKLHTKWWPRSLVQCDICQCVCDAHSSPYTIRKFSIASMSADEGYVITGVRFNVDNDIIYLQIQQSKLLASGIIDHSTRQWKELPEDRAFVTISKSMSILAGFSDTIESNDDTFLVLTDISFKVREKSLVLAPKFTTMKFDNNTIQNTNNFIREPIECKECNKHNNKRFDESSTEPTFIDFKDNPTLYYTNKPNGNDGYYQFTQSSMIGDVGQSTIPFFDAQPVVSSLFPINGIGLQVRDTEASGGFVAPVITTISYAKLMQI